MHKFHNVLTRQPDFDVYLIYCCFTLLLLLNFKQFDGSIVETHSSEVSLIGTIMANIEQAELTKHSVRALSLSETADQQSLQ
jgi:hypothetical protein